MVVTADASEYKDAIAVVLYAKVMVEVLEQCFDRGIVAKLRYHAKQILIFSGTFLDNNGYGMSLSIWCLLKVSFCHDNKKHKPH